jgi:hypothetical protein
MSAALHSYVANVLLFAIRPPYRGTRAVSRWAQRLRESALDPYRPELHYMRGPGPKWREKNVRFH